jgi:electron transfer flavoprotein alpha subunit
MAEIFVVIEHRNGEFRDISYEMLRKGHELSQQGSHSLTAVLLKGSEALPLQEIVERADKVIQVEDERLGAFDGELAKEILSRLIEAQRPFLTLVGHTSWGMDLAPALAVKNGLPMATDCVDVQIEDGAPKALRQVYSGKIFSKVAFKQSEGYLVTIRPGSFPPDRADGHKAEVVSWEIPAEVPVGRKRFEAFEDAGAGEVDITQAELLVSCGRGIGEEENLEVMKELAQLMGGVISCSRPVVDKNWLPKYHQVGTSGKSVKPKVYLAFGISGAFQHVAGVSGAGTVIAINKDKKAPIFRVADYGVVDDLFKVVDALKERLKSG